MGQQITPKLIAERHSTHPAGTVDMIEYYANMKVYEHIKELIKKSAVMMVNNNTVIVAAESEVWKKFSKTDVFAGVDIKHLRT